MRRYSRAIAAACVAVTALSTASSHAAGTSSFEIHEVVDFTGEGDNTFTASGLGDCTSGTFTDEVVAQAPRSGGFNLVIRTVFECSTGDDIYALKKVHFTFDTETSGHNTGPIQLLGGTGDFEDIQGHGVDNGTADFDAGVGHATITGFVVEGSM